MHIKDIPMQTDIIKPQEFKQFAKKLKSELFKKDTELSLGATYNLLSRTLGYDDYNTYKALNSTEALDVENERPSELTKLLNMSGLSLDDCRFTKEWLDKCPYYGIDTDVIALARDMVSESTKFVNLDELFLDIYNIIVRRVMSISGLCMDYSSIDILANGNIVEKEILSNEIKALEEGSFGFADSWKLTDLTKVEFSLALESLLLLQDYKYIAVVKPEVKALLMFLYGTVKKNHNRVKLDIDIPETDKVLSFELLIQIKKQVLVLVCDGKRNVEVPILDFIGDFGDNTAQVMTNEYFGEYIFSAH